jgi:hypothetical protein
MKKLEKHAKLATLALRWLLLLGIVGHSSAIAAESSDTVEVRGLLLHSEKAAPGYVLYSLGRRVYLIDRAGLVVHEWNTKLDGISPYLLENGNLLRTAKEPKSLFKAGGDQGRIQEWSWDGELLWDWKFADEKHWLHHDIQPMPGGNVLVIAWEVKSARESTFAGRRPDRTPKAGLWPTMILEVEPQRPGGGRIVWEWHMWDHLIQNYDASKANYGIPSEHPELIDINGEAKPPELDPKELARLKALGYVPPDAKVEDLGPDFVHTNAIDYNAELDQIVMSSPVYNEIWVIDHSTSSEQAAGHSGGRSNKGGDLLYRWGNPVTYGRGTEEQTALFGQHDIRWIEEGLPGAGHFLVFNNNVKGPDGDHSAVFELLPPLQPDGSYAMPTNGPFGPDQPIWKYEAPDKKSFHSDFISGARRQPNGNTLICSGATGRFFEVSPQGEIVWEFREPFGVRGQISESDPDPDFDPRFNHAVFRITPISPDHPGIRGRDLKPLDPQPPYDTAPPAGKK